ncbi:MAG: hypothetical protein EZS28_008676 [Streblomastix strix]|uniref:Uncharacterized protein n=1 Tax=Streblomastix strix TaxID=222440 RepID=A0A5J4WME4_9EUKA|nr:MAG: hypothetical protein EZS28_008676 [Streblomastix strix]
MKPLEGTDEEKKQIIENQENDCKLLIRTVKNKIDNIGRKQMIESGVVESLLFIFSNRDLNSITRSYSQTFFQLTHPSSDESKLLIYNKEPYPGLIRLLEHTDVGIASDAIASIFNIQLSGSSTTPDANPHPHYDSILACDGIKKIFALFQKNVCKFSRDRSALCIGYMFRAQQITDQIMRNEIISHLKSLLSDSEDWIKERAKNALKYLAQNEVNRNEILKYADLKKIEQDLKQPFVGTQQQQKQILQKQQTDLLLLSSVLENRDDNELCKQIISSGVVESLLFIYTNRDLNSITRSYSESFIDLLNKSSYESNLLLLEKKPYPGLIRLLEHPDDNIASDAIASIFLLLQAGSNTTPESDPHPHYDSMQESDGIKKIFALFQKNGRKFSRDRSALCIGYLFRAQQITDQIMRNEIISHLKSLLSDSNDLIKERAKDALKYLAQNEVNRTEIFKYADLKKIEQDLKQPFVGTKEYKKSILQKQETDLLLLSSVLHSREDFQFLSDAINAGIIDALLQIFTSRDLDEITRPYINAFISFTHPSNFIICQLLVEKQPFPSLLRLLEHKDENIVSDAVGSIDNVVYYTSLESELTSQHPFFAHLASVGGIEKIFSLFKQTTDEFCKICSAICLGIVHRAQEIKDSSLRKEVIAHLKSIINDIRDDIKKLVKYAIRCLVQNYVNKTEIESEGFTIPD